MDTKNEEFHLKSKGRGFGKSNFLGLGGILETSFSSSMLQEVGILPTLVYFFSLRIVWLCFCPKGCLG